MNRIIGRSLQVLVAVLALQGAAVMAQTPAPAAGAETGLAAVYSDKLNGRKTASGKIYRSTGMTAAHKTLPFGTKVKVTNTKNDKSTELTITDRGPVQTDRVLDITPRAAQALGISKRGMAPVSVVVVN
jgi:rare lipoprotein A